jgi:hypothetical protein
MTKPYVHRQTTCKRYFDHGPTILSQDRDIWHYHHVSNTPVVNNPIDDLAIDNDISAMTATERFAQEIKDAAARLGITPGTLCNYAVGNGSLWKRLKSGRDVTLETVDKVRAYIRNNPPAATKTPEPEGTEAT